jgi:FMN phosphatase YigB (HAD superfamily)
MLLPAPTPTCVLFGLGDTLLQEHTFDLVTGIDTLIQDRPHSAALALEFQTELTRSHETDGEILLAEWLLWRLPELEQSVQQLETLIWPKIVELAPTEHVETALGYLAARAIPMGVVSNAPFSGRILAGELSRHELLRHFRFVLSSADIGQRKPGTAILHQRRPRNAPAPELNPGRRSITTGTLVTASRKEGIAGRARA